MPYKKVRGNGKPISLPSRNNFGQLDYRVQVSKEFYDAANALYIAARADGACKNKTAPAWHDEENNRYTVTVRASQTGMYPLGVTRNQICRVTVQIGTDGYHKTIASATEEVAEKNAIVAEQKLDAVREALDDRRFTEQTTGIDAKLRSMVELAAATGIPLGDLTAADKAIVSEKERIAAQKAQAAQKSSTLKKFVPTGAKVEVAKTDTPVTNTNTNDVDVDVEDIEEIIDADVPADNSTSDVPF